MKTSILKKLSEIVGRENVSSKIEDLICYSYDATTIEHQPDIVISPSSNKEISKIVQIAYNEDIPIVPRGAGTGFAGGSINIKGGICMSLAKMNNIISIDENNFFTQVEPGVVNFNLKNEVEKRGLFYPPDPASLKVCTIGGNVSTCAGGPSAIKYGVTKDYVMGVEVVLADGRITTFGGVTLKGVVGYDFTKLITGSEGTLGIITKINLKLIPKPPSIITLAVPFKRIEEAAKTVVGILNEKIVPSCLEFMDRSAISCVRDLEPNLIPDCDAFLLIEVDGDIITVTDQTEKIKTVCLRNSCISINDAKDEKKRDSLWLARRSISPSLRKLNKRKINEDICVPRSKLPEAVKAIQAIAKKHNITIVCFGHAGDGNIHVNIMIDESNPKEVKTADNIVKEVFEVVLNLNGTISGEHGVGLAKKPYVRRELGDLNIDLMKGVKKVFDPKNLINPGKMF